jgi:excisionase family DNA binding protein
MSEAHAVPASYVAPPSSRRILESVGDAPRPHLVVELGDGRTVPLPEDLEALFLETINRLAEGSEVSVFLNDTEVSPAMAGKLLGFSRQYVDRLIAEGVLPARRLPGSTHRKLRVTDVMAFNRERQRKRRLITDMVERVVDAGADY